MSTTHATPSSPTRRRRGPLDAAELADAAISAALVMALLTTGRLLAAGTFFQVLGTIVMAVLGARRRTRAVAASTTASMALAVLLGGIGPITQAFVSGLFGWAGGVSIRRRYGLIRHVGLALAVCWPIVSAFTLAFLAVFADTRDLSLENGRNQWLGMAEILERIGLDALVGPGTRVVDWSIDYWWLMVPALQVVITIGYALIVRRLGRAVLQRVDTALGRPWHANPQPPAETVAPVPIAFNDPVIDRNGHDVALIGMSGALGPGDIGSLTGANGVGKTSFLEGLAGLDPAIGISRQGNPGLGAPGGTALIGQRPETQVVGLRVVDDLRWGHPQLDDDAVTAALHRVGLDQHRDRATSELSGGELQRLAVAAALARRPALILSDEATSMLDPAGRASIIDQLVRAAAAGATVLHSTHLSDDLDAIPEILTLGDAETRHPRLGPSRVANGPIPVLEAIDVGFTHSAGSPWARPTLHGIDLAVRPGGLAVVVGANGSGKTTLGRLLAGLDEPTEGTITLAGRPLTGPTPAIAIAFQHPRLQLLRSTVLQELASLAGTRDTTHLYAALSVVGLDGGVHAGRRIDTLSGGQQRRVLLAGIYARESDVVILDEPLAGLDAPGRGHLERAIDALRARGTAVVVVSHDPIWAAGAADTVLELPRVAEPVRSP